MRLAETGRGSGVVSKCRFCLDVSGAIAAFHIIVLKEKSQELHPSPR